MPGMELFLYIPGPHIQLFIILVCANYESILIDRKRKWSRATNLLKTLCFCVAAGIVSSKRNQRNTNFASNEVILLVGASNEFIYQNLL